jgi:hypothetical protein
MFAIVSEGEAASGKRDNGNLGINLVMTQTGDSSSVRPAFLAHFLRT